MYRIQIHYYAEIIKIRNSLFFSLFTIRNDSTVLRVFYKQERVGLAINAKILALLASFLQATIIS